MKNHQSSSSQRHRSSNNKHSRMTSNNNAHHHHHDRMTTSSSSSWIMALSWMVALSLLAPTSHAFSTTRTGQFLKPLSLSVSVGNNRKDDDDSFVSALYARRQSDEEEGSSRLSLAHSKRARVARYVRGKFRRSSSSSSTALDASPNNNDNDNSNNNLDDTDNSRSTDSIVIQKYKALVQAYDQAVEQAWNKLPEPLQIAWQKIAQFFGGLRLVLVSFTAGCIFATAAVLIPVYNQVESLSQPVTLFETILSDLEAGYVDPVDTTKLFETGVSAMLRSLDPYTEYEGPQEAAELTESIDGKYGGVGLVISGTTEVAAKTTTATNDNNNAASSSDNAVDNTVNNKNDDNNPNSGDSASNDDAVATPLNGQPVASSFSPRKITLSNSKGATIADNNVMDNNSMDDDEDENEDDMMTRQQEQRFRDKIQQRGIVVVNAFENYAFDYGMRVGDKLVAIDDDPIDGKTVEDVRNKLRGEPGTLVSISFEREGVSGVQTITMPRSVVRVRDVKLATLMGKPSDGIGYIQLSGFASETGREMRNAIHFLQRAAEDASDGEHSLQGLVLDLRGNPGGLLTSAVDVASLLVPKGSDIVSAKGRGFPGVLYRSRVDPILDANTKLAVLVNRNTASAAEIVSGAVQDLDVGLIVGSDRTFGKGLVQNVEELPFKSALKFTVAKYYTPSGRCIQAAQYKEGGGLREEDGKFIESRIPKKDRGIFYTKNGRTLRDGGGVEADFRVPAPKASALEVTLLRSGVLADFAADWSKTHELSNNFNVDEDTYRSFQSYVMERQKSGDLQLEAIYSKSLNDLKKMLKQSGYKGSEREVEALQASIVRDIQRDFEKYRKDIKEDIAQTILARYLPESMLIERSVKNDVQVSAAIKLLTADGSKFDKLLARETPEASPSSTQTASAGDASLRVATSNDESVRGQVDF